MELSVKIFECTVYTVCLSVTTRKCIRLIKKLFFFRCFKLTRQENSTDEHLRFMGKENEIQCYGWSNYHVRIWILFPMPVLS